MPPWDPQKLQKTPKATRSSPEKKTPTNQLPIHRNCLYDGSYCKYRLVMSVDLHTLDSGVYANNCWTELLQQQTLHFLLSPGGTVIQPSNSLFSVPGSCEGPSHCCYPGLTHGLHGKNLGLRKPTDLDIGFCFGLKNTAALSKQACRWLDIWEGHVSELHLKAGVGINNNLHIRFIVLILLP